MLLKIFKNKLTEANGVYGDKTIATYKYVESLIRRYMSLLAIKQQNKTKVANSAMTIQSDITSYINSDGTYVMHTCIFHALNPNEDLTRFEFIHGIEEEPIEPEPTTITIHGIVQDSSTYGALSEVLVTDVDDASTFTTTDSDGMFTLEIESWNRTLAFYKTEYTPITKTASYFTEVGSSPVTAYMTSKNYMVYGLVKDASTGDALQDVAVKYNSETIATTNADGKFSATTQDGRDLLINKTGYNGQSLASSSLSKSEASPTEISLSPIIYTLYGIVTDSSTGFVLSGAQVQINNQTVATTGLDGKFTLQVKTHRAFGILKSGYDSYVGNTSSLSRIESLPTYIQMDPNTPVTSTVDGKIIDASTNDPIIGAIVRLDTTTQIISATTDLLGVFTIEVPGTITPTTPSFYIMYPSYVSGTVPVNYFTRLSTEPLVEYGLSPEPPTPEYIHIQGRIVDAATREGLGDAIVCIYEEGQSTPADLVDIDGEFHNFIITSWDDRLKISETNHLTRITEDARMFTEEGSATVNNFLLYSREPTSSDPSNPSEHAEV